MLKRFLIVLLSVSLTTGILSGQTPKKPTSIEIYHQLEKLNFLGSVLYIAAHPDDENTRLISYFSNHIHARTAYLSITRGDGGQNLIGSEIGPELGLIRTHELLAARKIDGGEQFFSRAIDFGFSKHPDETLRIWNKDEVLHDIVKVIRQYKPDIIVNRFDHRSPGSTHGHHTSSAILSVEAFDLSADAEYSTNKLPHSDVWQASRLFFNTSWWFYGGREQFDKADKSNLVAVDAGVYYPTLGLSNLEIATLSRSMHQCQGMGRIASRGAQTEYLELLKGEKPQDNTNPFDGINTNWSRVEGGEVIGQKISKVLSQFDFSDPSSHTPELVEIYNLIQNIDDSHWREIKLQELKEIIVAVNGLFIEAIAEKEYSPAGSKVSIESEIINRSSIEMTWKGLTINDIEQSITPTPLLNNEKQSNTFTYQISPDAAATNPYWLEITPDFGMYHVADQSQIGKPESDQAIIMDFNIEILGQEFQITRPVVYKKGDPVKGEIYSPFAVLPRASVSFVNPVYIFSDRTPKTIQVKVKSYSDELKGKVIIRTPNSWIVSSQPEEVHLKGRGAEATYSFTIKAPILQESAQVQAYIVLDDGSMLGDAIQEVDYDHIPKQYVKKSANARLNRINVNISGNKIAYLSGAGDQVAQSLQQIGYQVDIIDFDDLELDVLKQYDALVMGIRAYNTNPDLQLKKEVLTNYMSQGHNVIVQYNTHRSGVKGENIGPFPFVISRDRVTYETAPMNFVDSSHEVLNFPNKITSQDFRDWVQERGLYFARNIDSRYITPIACNDPGDELSKGALLIAPVGKGNFVYTGISFFRQLPAGVPGAYRLLANLISIGHK